MGDAYLRVWVREPARAGLRDEVIGLLPNALEVRIDPEFAAPVERVPAGRDRRVAPRGPAELFREYLGTRGGRRSAGRALFRRLHDRRGRERLMRPVLLEMDGFASFREPTTVDFAGADYFALVGPTGAGKSTVIDAMTFALYGSVPRWDDRRTVALALAPTAGRGAVRFVFDVGGQRYVVARELRRAAGSGAVSVRNARLERLVDPAGTGAASRRRPSRSRTGPRRPPRR